MVSKTPRFYLLIAAAVLTGIAVIVGGLLQRARGPTEPVYAGRRLTFWLQPLVGIPSGAHKPPNYNVEPQEAQQVLEALGTNSVPFLVRSFRMKPSPLRRWLNSVLEKQPLLAFRLAKQPDYPELARTALRALGPRAWVAIPDLIALLRDEDEHEALNVCETLGRMYPASTSALIGALTNENKTVRLNAAISLGLPPQAKSAIPALRAALEDPAPEVRLTAALVLLSLEGPMASGAFDAAVLACLRERDPKLRCVAARCAVDCKPEERAVLSGLLRALEDGNESVRIEAACALLRVNPQVAHQARVWYDKWDPFPGLSPRALRPRYDLPVVAMAVGVLLLAVTWSALQTKKRRLR